MRPFISVVIPTHDRKEILERTLSTLLRQTYPKDRHEIIVVSDARDGTNEMAEGLGARLVRSESRWPDRKRNEGLQQARGEIIAFTDDDCMPNEDWIEKIAEGFEKNPGIMGIEGRTVKNSRGLFLHASENLVGGLFPACNLAFRKDALERAGGFDENYRFFREDTDIGFRVQEIGEVVFWPEAEVFHPPRRVSKAAVLRELVQVRGDVRLWKKFPEKYRKAFGFLGRGGLKQAGFIWGILALIIVSALLGNFLLPAVSIAGIIVFKYLVSLRGKEYTWGEAAGFILLSSLRDLAFPFFLGYYLANVRV